MADLLGTAGEALASYWSSDVVLGIVAVVAAALGTLLYVFLTNARNAKLRVSLLTGFYALTVFFWIFVATSLLLCIMDSDMVAYRTFGVRAAAAGAVLFGVLASSILSYVVWRVAARRVLTRFAAREPRPDERWATDYLHLLSQFEGIGPIALLVTDRPEPLALAVGGTRPAILVSRGLLDLLDRAEVHATVAHELMHVKNHDAEFKVFSAVFSRILFFDPLSKLFDPAVHREREYLADEMSGRSTGRPAALASALLQIAGRGSLPRTTWGLSILGPGRGVFSRYPPLPERIRRLLLLSELLEKASNP